MCLLFWFLDRKSRRAKLLLALGFLFLRSHLLILNLKLKNESDLVALISLNHGTRICIGRAENIFWLISGSTARDYLSQSALAPVAREGKRTLLFEQVPPGLIDRVDYDRF